MVEYAQRNSDGYYETEDVIKWFLAKESMSPKKLQKLLYYAYSWTLTLQNVDVDSLENKLFNSEFEAWIHGPVIPEVYHEFRGYGYHEIEKNTDGSPIFESEIEDVLNQVWDVYGGYTGNELESFTHKETPWINARKGYKPLDRCREKISDKDIFQCYGERL